MSLVMCRLTFLIISYQEIGKCISTKFYKRVVLFVHGLCTKSTKPLY